MSTQIVFNQGGTVAVTPASSEPLDITVAGRKTYSVVWDTNAGTTINNFVAAHAQSLSNDFGIYAVDSSATLNLSGIGDAVITSSEATVGTVDPTDELTIAFEQIAQVLVASATSLTINAAANVLPSASDVLTLDFVSASDRKKGFAELSNIKAAARRGAALVKFGVAASASVA